MQTDIKYNLMERPMDENLRYQVVETNMEFDSTWIIASSNYKHIAEKCRDEYNTKRKFGVKYEVVDSQA